LTKHHVKRVVRVCSPTYETEPLEKINISVHDLPFKDGGTPPTDVIKTFLSICFSTFKSPLNFTGTRNVDSPCIAIHCVAGLGRAPVLVAIALIESGMQPLDAIEFIRRRRRGAFNSVQLQFLVDSYKRSWSKSSGMGKWVRIKSLSPGRSVTTASSSSSSSSPSIWNSIDGSCENDKEHISGMKSEQQHQQEDKRYLKNTTAKFDGIRAKIFKIFERGVRERNVAMGVVN